MTERLYKIYYEIPKCKVFADIGCDHGYLAKAMLQGGKCNSVILSDISAKCLEKARDLMRDDIAEGRAQAIVSNGFEKLPKVDCALIAGMGGEEIISILLKAKNLPEKLVLQPMKNTDKVRKKVVELGYKIVKDYTFLVGKIFYDLIVLEKGQDSLSEEEIKFGRTNLELRPSAFINSIKLKIENLSKVLNNGNLSECTKIQVTNQIKELEKYV